MKKSGTPIFAGPGVASAKLGLVGAGLPSEFVSFGTGAVKVTSFGVVVLTHPRVEVEVQAFAEPVRAFDWFAGRACLPCFGAGVAVAVAVGALVVVSVGAGALVPVLAGVGESVGASVGVSVGACVGVSVGAAVG